jgi:transcriptional regulator with XRE-family HTH domain
MTDLKLHRASLERHRKLAGYSVPALAKEMGVTPDHMYRLEWGDRRPSPALYKRLKEQLRRRDARIASIEQRADLLLQRLQSQRSAASLDFGRILDWQRAQLAGAVPIELSSVELGTALEHPDAILERRRVKWRSIPAANGGLE